MRYYFYCPHCGEGSITEKLPSRTVPNIRDGYGIPIRHYGCPKCGNLDAGFMELDRAKIPDHTQKEYFRTVIGHYQNIRGFAKRPANEYIRFFKHMDEENKKDLLGGMAWDEVGWWVYDATKTDELFTMMELHEMFPDLIRLPQRWCDHQFLSRDGGTLLCNATLLKDHAIHSCPYNGLWDMEKSGNLCENYSNAEITPVE